MAAAALPPRHTSGDLATSDVAVGGTLGKRLLGLRVVPVACAGRPGL
jgi:hypothetical protein